MSKTTLFKEFAYCNDAAKKEKLFKIDGLDGIFKYTTVDSFTGDIDAIVVKNIKTNVMSSHFNEITIEFINEVIASYDDWFYDDEMSDCEAQTYLETAWEEFKSTVESHCTEGFILVEGSVNSWNGSHEVDVQFLEDFDEILSNLKDTDRLECELKANGLLIVKNHHHDGTNYYEFVVVGLYNLDDLKESIKESGIIEKLIDEEIIESRDAFFDDIVDYNTLIENL